MGLGGGGGLHPRLRLQRFHDSRLWHPFGHFSRAIPHGLHGDVVVIKRRLGGAHHVYRTHRHHSHEQRLQREINYGTSYSYEIAYI